MNNGILKLNGGYQIGITLLYISNTKVVLLYYAYVIPNWYDFIVHKQYLNGITLLNISNTKVVLLYYTYVIPKWYHLTIHK